MDYDKLIEDIRKIVDKNSISIYKRGKCADTATVADAATAIETLRADLARVTADRDAAVADLTFAVNKYRLFTTDIDLCYLCKFNFPSSGENEQTYECPGCYGDDCFEWRGPQKEDLP